MKIMVRLVAKTDYARCFLGAKQNVVTPSENPRQKSQLQPLL